MSEQKKIPLDVPQPVKDDLPWSYEDEREAAKAKAEADARAEDRAARRAFERESWPRR